MVLSSLVVCPDDSATQLLCRILRELRISVEHRSTGREAQALIECKHFDSILIDCQNESEAAEVLHAARASSRSAKSLAIAIAGKENNVRHMFGLGINFVLYKPVSEDRAWSSLRAARSLMRREQRGSRRVPVHAPVSLDYANLENVPATLLDLSEEGTALQSESKLPPDCRVYFQFSLPGHASLIRLSGEVVWQHSAGRVGMRFLNVPSSSRRMLQRWLKDNVHPDLPSVPLVPRTSGPIVKTTTPVAGSGNTSSDSATARLRSSPGNRREQTRHACRLGAELYRAGVSVPNRCSLTDISSGGCYVEMPTPFPPGTRVEIIVRTQNLKLRTQGVVQATHPGFGMGVQLTLKTADDHDQVESLIRLLAESGTLESGPLADPWTR